jgi:hypothetical protein
MREDPAADDEVPRRVELEQKQLARRQRLEGLVRRRPEIDLRQVRLPPQQVEPVAVGNGYDEVDGHSRRSLPITPIASRCARGRHLLSTV